MNGSKANPQKEVNVSACSNSDPDSLSEQFSSKFLYVSNLLVSNRLKVNDDKTHLLPLTSSQTRKARTKANRSLEVSIEKPTATVTPTSSEELLGRWVHRDLKWAEHILEVEEISEHKTFCSKVGW